MRLRCPSCGTQHDNVSRVAGAEIRCGCGVLLRAPLEPAQAPPPPPAPAVPAFTRKEIVRGVLIALLFLTFFVMSNDQGAGGYGIMGSP